MFKTGAILLGQLTPATCEDWAKTTKRHADLWAHIAAHARARRVVARWVKAHLTLEQAIARGHSQEDWQGNRAADRAAGRAAERRMPDGCVRSLAVTEGLLEYGVSAGA